MNEVNNQPSPRGKGGFGQVYVGRSMTDGSGKTTTDAAEAALNNVQINDTVAITRASTRFRPVVDHKLFYAGLKYTAGTFAVAMGNIIPAMTFLITWVCRSEKVNIKKIHSIGKIVGTPVIVGGATIMTLVVRPTSRLPWTSATHASGAYNIKGSMMIIAGYLSWSCFYIVQ
ncbi:WAT1-related protein, partial [Tanacetum coccineum]